METARPYSVSVENCEQEMKISMEQVEALADAFYESQTGYDRRKTSVYAERWLQVTKKCLARAGFEWDDEEEDEDVI